MCMAPKKRMIDSSYPYSVCSGTIELNELMRAGNLSYGGWNSTKRTFVFHNQLPFFEKKLLF